MSESNNLQSLQYSNESKPTLRVLDQLLIPQSKTYIPIESVNDAWDVIRKMQIRGAPLIAIVACLGLAVDLSSNPSTLEELEKCDDKEGIRKLIAGKVEYLRTSRPTAVNLFNALEELTKSVDSVERKEDVIDAVIGHAEMMLKRDVSDNEAIGKHGADALLDGRVDGGVRMMTICNTGSLATAGFGTALGVARELQRRGKLDGITALETRPYNQGSRLTAFEIMEEKMPNGSLICDGMAASFMKNKGCDAVIVGADRVCANGDTANKIGTYNLSIIAKAHNVPFYVASPFTTLDVNLQNGDQIQIEERPPKELLDTSRAPKDMPCWNPAFDVTPATFIKGIITERGVIHNQGGVIDVLKFVKEHTQTTTATQEDTHVDQKMKIAH